MSYFMELSISAGTEHISDRLADFHLECTPFSGVQVKITPGEGSIEEIKKTKILFDADINKLRTIRDMFGAAIKWEMDRLEIEE